MEDIDRNLFYLNFLYTFTIYIMLVDFSIIYSYILYVIDSYILYYIFYIM